MMLRKQEQEGTMATTAVTIDPKAIPKEDIQTACAVLASSIRLALKDPAKRAEYEAWKQKKEDRA